MKRALLSSMLWTGLCSALLADDLVSGPAIGKPAPAFEMQVVTGDDADKEVDYLTRWKDKPVLVVFVGEMTRPGFGLLVQLDKYGRLRQPEGLEVLIVRVSDDAEAVTRQSKVLFERFEVKSPAGVTREGKAGPKEYGLHEDAAMTVLLLDKEHKVIANFARRTPDREDFAAIRKEMDKLLGPSPVPFP